VLLEFIGWDGMCGEGHGDEDGVGYSREREVERDGRLRWKTEEETVEREDGRKGGREVEKCQVCL